MEKQDLSWMKNRSAAFLHTKFQQFYAKNDDKANILKFLFDKYKDEVTIMPEDGKYGAATLAKASIEAAAVFGAMPITDVGKEELCQLVLALYETKKGVNEMHVHSAVDESSEKYKENRKITLELQRQMDIQYQDEVISEGGGEFDALTGGEIIELIHDWKLSQDANAEGMRAIGLLPADFNSETDTVPTGLAVDAPKYALMVTPEDSEDFGLRCPDCFAKTGLLMLGGTKYSCLNCDSEFVTDTRLEDFIDYHPEVDEEGNQLVDEEGNPFLKPSSRRLSKTEQKIKEQFPDAGFKRIETEIESITDIIDDDDDY